MTYCNLLLLIPTPIKVSNIYNYHFQITHSTRYVLGTVGCVVMYNGHVSAGTSTGGMTNKLAGRVGDTPINGAGNYANDRTCAVSGTGRGEDFMRHLVAYDISAQV